MPELPQRFIDFSAGQLRDVSELGALPEDQIESRGRTESDRRAKDLLDRGFIHRAHLLGAVSMLPTRRGGPVRLPLRAAGASVHQLRITDSLDIPSRV
jgi:hypothetical protein